MTAYVESVAPAGSCKHRPISNGWSSGGGMPAASWCGYCRSLVEIDAEWIEKFRLAGKAVPEPHTSP